MGPEINVPSGSQNIWYVDNTQGTQGTTAEEMGLYYLDTQSSGSGSITQIYPPNSALPSLQVPFFLEKLGFDFKLGQDEIISKMLDSWNDQIKKQADETHRMLSSPAYQAWLEHNNPAHQNELRHNFPNAYETVIKGSAEFQSYIMSLNPQQRALELQQIAQNEEAMRVGLISVADNYVQKRDEGNPGAFMTLPLLAGSLINIGFLAGNIVEKATESAVGQSLQALQQQIPVFLMDTATITINLFATALMSFSAQQTVADSAAGDKKPVTADMAKNLAANTIALITNNEIPGAMLAMLKDRIVGSTPVTQQQIDQLTNIAKVMLAMNALILLYRTETGGGTPEEIAALIQGKMSSTPGSQEAMLLNLINQYRTDLPPDIQQALFASMLKLTDRSQDLQDMLDPMLALEASLKSEDFDTINAKRLESRGA